MITMYVTGPPPKMVDVACYLTHNRYQQDRENVMRRASEAGIQFLQPIPHFFMLPIKIVAGVGVVIVPSLHLKGSNNASRLAKQFPGRVYFTAGRNFLIAVLIKFHVFPQHSF